MKLFIDYIKEREGKEVLIKDWGFAVFEIKEKHLFVQDVFICEEERREGRMTQIGDELVAKAKEAGCDLFITQVDLNGKGAREALLSQMSFGLVPCQANAGIITLRKGI